MPANSPDDIDLGSVLGAARRALPKAVLLGLLLGGGTAAAFMTMAPRYASQATVEIVGRPTSNPLNPAAGGESRNDPDREAVGTHVRKMLSNDVVVPLIKDLDLVSRPEFNAALPPVDLFSRGLRLVGIGAPKASQSDEDRVLAEFRDRMKVAQLRETRNIQIEFTTTDPALSARGANRLAEIYRDSLTVTRQDETGELREKLRIEVERLQQEVAEADKRVAEFRGQRDLFKGGQSSTPLKEQQLALLTEELTRAASARMEAQTRADAAKEQMARGTAEGNPDVQKSQIIPRLTEQRVRLERQVSELSATLLPAHPRMRQLQGDLATLKRQINDEVRKVVDALDRDARIALDRETSVQRRIDGLKTSVTTAAPDDARLKGFEDVARAKRTEAERVQQAYQKAVSTQTTGDAPVEVKIVQRALPSSEKVWPKLWLAGLVGLAGLLSSLFLTITRALMRGPIAAVATPVDRTTTVRLEATDTGAAASKPARLPRVQAGAAPAPAAAGGGLGAVANQILMRAAKTGTHRTLVAGSRPTVDAALEALDLAKAIARSGAAVVLVDWSAGPSSLASVASAVASPGLAELVRGDAAFEDVIQRLADSDAHYLPAGQTGDDAGVLFDPDRANLVLDALDEAYAYVVVIAGHQAARDLFQAIQGRIDSGVLVTTGGAPASSETAFLGFEVPGLEVFRIARGGSPGGRMAAAPRSARLADARA
jgi:uncharacterized protein involved in exopolysaccharide biosynthesis